MEEELPPRWEMNLGRENENHDAVKTDLDLWLYTLRMCESGGEYAINKGNGYYGAYQFLISSWNNIAVKSSRSDLIGIRPDLASPVDQDFMIVQNTLLSEGLVTQNPGCYEKTGLSNKPPVK